MYKFYIARFTHKKNKLLKEERVNPEAYFLFKGGITHHNEALDRFDPKVNDHYKKDYGDWHIKIWYSQNFQTEEVSISAIELALYIVSQTDSILFILLKFFIFYNFIYMMEVFLTKL